VKYVEVEKKGEKEKNEIEHTPRLKTHQKIGLLAPTDEIFVSRKPSNSSKSELRKGRFI